MRHPAAHADAPAAGQGRIGGTVKPKLGRREFEDLHYHPLVVDAPTRARSVLALLTLTERGVADNRKDKRRRRRVEARERQHAKRRRRWHEPDTRREKGARRVKEIMGEEFKRAPDEDGEVGMALRVAARFMAPEIARIYRLDPLEAIPLEEWLVAKFGDVLRDPDIRGFVAWREECRRLGGS